MDGTVAAPRARRITIVISILAALISGVLLLGANESNHEYEWSLSTSDSNSATKNYDSEATEIVRNPYSHSEFLQGSLTSFKDWKPEQSVSGSAGVAGNDASQTALESQSNYAAEAASIIGGAESKIDYSRSARAVSEGAQPSSGQADIASEAEAIVTGAISSNNENIRAAASKAAAEQSPAVTPGSDQADARWHGTTVEWARDDKDLADAFDKSLNPMSDADGPGATANIKTISGRNWTEDVDGPLGAGKDAWKGLGNVREPNIWSEMNPSNDTDAPTSWDKDVTAKGAHSPGLVGDAGGGASGAVGGGGSNGGGGSGSGEKSGKASGGDGWGKIRNEWDVVNNDHIGKPDIVVSPQPAPVIVGYEEKTVRQQHGGSSDCYLRPLDCPLRPVYFTDDVVKVPIYGPAPPPAAA